MGDYSLPPSELLVRVESEFPGHAEMYQTLDLLAIELADGSKVYFVIEGSASFASVADMNAHLRYYYEEHTCAVNFLGASASSIVEIFHRGHSDPHGIFEHVESRWMTIEYVKAKSDGNAAGYLKRLFPQITGTYPIRPLDA